MYQVMFKSLITIKQCWSLEERFDVINDLNKTMYLCINFIWADKFDKRIDHAVVNCLTRA